MSRRAASGAWRKLVCKTRRVNPADKTATAKPVRALFAALALLAITGSSIAGEYERIAPSDGDSGAIQYRLINVDTPESSYRYGAKCDAEIALAAKATAFVKDFLRRAKRITVAAGSWDLYGRLRVRIAGDGVDLGEALIAEGLGHKWAGSRARSGSWCP